MNKLLTGIASDNTISNMTMPRLPTNKFSVRKGAAGERALEYWARLHGWTLFRTQPATKCIGFDRRYKRPIVIYSEDGGISDYTGYVGANPPHYVAVECKCHDGDTMPASVLTMQQRQWMGSLPKGCAFVFVVWQSGTPEMYEFIEKGSYKRSKGD